MDHAPGYPPAPSFVSSALELPRLEHLPKAALGYLSAALPYDPALEASDWVGGGQPRGREMRLRANCAPPLSWSKISHGHGYFDGWRRITRGCPLLWRGYTLLPSLAIMSMLER